MILALGAAPAGGALAQPKSAIDEARALAQQGWKALDAENYAEALENVTKAEALYHAPIHLLLMGNAQAGLGRLADALATFETLAAEPIPDAAPKAFKEAQETGRKRVKELIARVPSVLVAVQNTDATDAVIEVDGKVVSFAGGVAVRFDPGEHKITVKAEGFKPAATSITLPEKGGVVRVPVLLERPQEAGPGGEGPAGAPSGAASASASTSASGAGGLVLLPPPPARTRVPAFVAFGVAGAGVIAGAVAGGMSLAMTGELKEVCADNLCPENQRGKLDSANTLAHISTATFVLGGVAAVAGIVLLSIDLGSAAPRSQSLLSVTVEPWISAGGAGVRGRF